MNFRESSRSVAELPLHPPSSTRCRPSRVEMPGWRGTLKILTRPKVSIPKCSPADVTSSHGRRETSQRRGKSLADSCVSPTACLLANQPGAATGSRNAEPSSSPFTSRTKTPHRRLWAALDCTRPRATRLRGAASAYTHPIVMNTPRATAIGGLPWPP